MTLIDRTSLPAHEDHRLRRENASLRHQLKEALERADRTLKADNLLNAATSEDVVFPNWALKPTPHYKELPDDTKATAQTQPTSNGDSQHRDPNQPSNGQGQSRRKNAGREAKAIRRA